MEYNVIWLPPQCSKAKGECGHPDEMISGVVGGRTWSKHCVWNECPECGAKPVRYVLAEQEPIARLLPATWPTND